MDPITGLDAVDTRQKTCPFRESNLGHPAVALQAKLTVNCVNVSPFFPRAYVIQAFEVEFIDWKLRLLTQIPNTGNLLSCRLLNTPKHSVVTEAFFNKLAPDLYTQDSEAAIANGRHAPPPFLYQNLISLFY